MIIEHQKNYELKYLNLQDIKPGECFFFVADFKGNLKEQPANSYLKIKIRDNGPLLERLCHLTLIDGVIASDESDTKCVLINAKIIWNFH